MDRALYQGNVTTVVILGFHNIGTFNLLLFILILIMYSATICANLLIVSLVALVKTLQSPMYIFLTQLSIAEIIITTDISPNMLNVVLHEKTSMSFSGCITQLYFFSVSEAFECFILTVMSYDRYLAICSPLHYASVMSQELCFKLIFFSWMLSCAIECFVTCTLCQLEFCGPNTVDHFFCDLNPLVKLSCSDVSVFELEVTLLGIPVVVLPFLVILVSYTNIILTIIKIPSLSGKQKAFSTCSSHVTVVSIFYGTLFGMYLVPSEGKSQAMSKALAMLYTVFTPFLNPFIYSLTNKGIMEAFRKVRERGAHYLTSWKKIQQ